MTSGKHLDGNLNAPKWKAPLTRSREGDHRHWWVAMINYHRTYLSVSRCITRFHFIIAKKY